MVKILVGVSKPVQDIEFTIQQNKLYMLQTRTGKRTAHAALQIAVDMANEGHGTHACSKEGPYQGPTKC